MLSVQASFDFTLRLGFGEKCDWMRVIRALLDSGYRFERINIGSANALVFIPLGGDYGDWVAEDISEDQLRMVFREKSAKGEVIGVTMIFKGTDVGFQLLLNPDNTISFVLNINRKTLDLYCGDRSVTDVNWYLERLIPAVSSIGYYIDAIEFAQVN